MSTFAIKSNHIVLPNHEVKQFMKEGTVLYDYWFKK